MNNSKTLNLAREWADNRLAVRDAGLASLSPRTIAAEEIIRSLPDSWVDADKLRKVINRELSGYDHGTVGYSVAQDLACKMQHLFPEPEPRTMAEIEWDDEEHPYMEAVTVSGRRLILLAPMGNTAVSENTILVAEYGGGIPVLVPAEHLTPTGRYGRLSLPDEEGNEPAPPTPESASIPSPEDVPPGEPWQVETDGKEAIGFRNDPEDKLSWTVVYRDNAAHDWLFDDDVTLIARLVPETTEPDAATEFDPAYTYTDRDGDKWSYVAGGWNLGGNAFWRTRNTPPAEYGPYTRIEDTK